MKLYLPTYLDQELTLEGRLGSAVEGAFWPYDEKSLQLGKPVWVNGIRSEHIIPTRILEPGVDLCKDIASFVKDIESAYNAEAKQLQSQIESLQTAIDEAQKKNRTTKGNEKKLAKKEERLSFIMHFLNHIHDNVRLEGPFHTKDGEVHHLVFPPIEPDLRQRFLPPQFVHNDYLSAKRQVLLNAGFPSGLVRTWGDFEEGLDRAEIEVPLETMLNAKAVAYDFETHNWKHIRVMDELADQTEDAIMKRYH
ncbi:hypothetical protein JW868_02345, partial [Candidatus Woesearchaeota archaeon]|nr:hypothetical protein [Candidatus Woesearchaeota archaeon]